MTPLHWIRLLYRMAEIERAERWYCRRANCEGYGWS
jgi:hypothetical protein